MKIALTIAIALLVSACSVHFEVGYHGQTGRDDRIQSQLVQGRKVVKVND